MARCPHCGGRQQPRIPAGSDADEARAIRVTPDMRETIDRAILAVRKSEDCQLTEGRSLELICADWLAGA